MPWFLAEFHLSRTHSRTSCCQHGDVGAARAKLNASDVVFVLPAPLAACAYIEHIHVHEMMQSAPHRQGECMSDMT